MNGGKMLLDEIKIRLSNGLVIWIDVFDHVLSRKWLKSLNDILIGDYKLEKNYCWFGFVESKRDGEYLCEQINHSIHAINAADIGYHIDEVFTMQNALQDGPVGSCLPGLLIVKEKFNRLHRYFEDLQGTSGCLSKYYLQADPMIRWHIRQLNLLCHEFESWALSHRKQIQAPEWQRPSQLMCWLNAPRFQLQTEDLDFFGVETLYRPTGGVFLGVNKAIGKHHWEVFQDEGRDSRIGELITSTLRSQTEASADFDIEWAQDTRGHPWMVKNVADFRQWLEKNGFDERDKTLTIGHPQVGQVNLNRTFGDISLREIWKTLSQNLDVISVSTSHAKAEYPYHWQDPDYIDFMIGGKNEMA